MLNSFLRILPTLLLAQLMTSPGCFASGPQFLDLLNRPLEEILEIQDSPGRIELVVDTSSESDQPPCNRLALSFSQTSLATLTQVFATGHISFCLEPETHRVSSVSAVIYSLDGKDSGMPAQEFLKSAGTSYRVSRRPIIETEEGLTGVISPCEAKDGEVEFWIFEDQALEALIERKEQNEPMVTAFYFGEGYGGDYPLCSDTSEP